ncbi:MAG TPA: hypothetical protein VH185_01675 [Mycobacterium sp.]|nr:hypothetical protein [Mycobacterium sp.]
MRNATALCVDPARWRGAANGTHDRTIRAGRVVILAEHRSAAVPTDERPLPSVDKYGPAAGAPTTQPWPNSAATLLRCSRRRPHFANWVPAPRPDAPSSA